MRLLIIISTNNSRKVSAIGLMKGLKEVANYSIIDLIFLKFN